MRKGLKCIAIGLMVLVGTLFAGNQVFAANTIGYTGPLDPITGEPLTDENGNTGSTVSLSTNSWYDFQNARFVYSFGGGDVYCTVADGMVVTDEVYLGFDGNPEVILYKDGDVISPFPDSVTEPGSYIISSLDKTTYSDSLSFQIVSKQTGDLMQYVMPEGFYISGVVKDGVEIAGGYGSVDLTEEGYYDISYICGQTQLGYSLKVYVDHTPPQVEFKGVNKKDIAKGPVTLVGLEETDTVYVTKDGSVSKLNYKNQLKDSGRYNVTVTDAAGNKVERSFKIMIYLNMKAWMFVGIMLLIVLGVIIALFVSRKRLRVR